MNFINKIKFGVQNANIRRQRKKLSHSAKQTKLPSKKPIVYSQTDSYIMPLIVEEFHQNLDDTLDELIQNSKLDEYNGTFLDKHIDSIIWAAQADLQKQRREHIRRINERKQAYQGYLICCQSEQKKLEEKLAQMQEEDGSIV